MPKKSFVINEKLARRLIETQFPQWKNLEIRSVAIGGWDNRTFHLGEHMLMRMPSAAHYEAQVEKEQFWLPKLAPFLPVAIPTPLAMGKPAEGYPWKWSIYRWLEGTTVASTQELDLSNLAKELAQFLAALQRTDTTDGPKAGPHSFYRGGSLTAYDTETRQAIMKLSKKIDVKTATNVWETALATTWNNPPVWVHGDISAGNLLTQQGQLSAVIDFGQLAIGDPACDLAIAWTLFRDKSREIFKAALPLDAGTWARGRAWTLWKALIVAADLTNTNNVEAKKCRHIIDEVLIDYKNYSSS